MLTKLNKFVNKFKIKAPIIENNELNVYLKKFKPVKANYLYDCYCLNGYTKFAVVENQAINKLELNEDIRKLRALSNTAITNISYKFEDIRPMLNEENKPDYFMEANGYNIYINKEKSRIYESQELIAYIERTLTPPVVLMGLNSNNGTKSFLIGMNSNDIKEIDPKHTDNINIYGEYFGLVKNKSSNEVYYIYGFKDA